MASIRRYAKGRWEVSIQLQGRQCRRIFYSREEGEAWMGETLRDLREARNPGSMPRPLKEVVDKYIAYKAAKGKRTVGHDQRIFTKQLVPFFGPTTPIADITAERIAQYELRRATEVQPTLKRPIMSSTINRHLSILRGLLRLANERRHRARQRQHDQAQAQTKTHFLGRDWRKACMSAFVPLLGLSGRSCIVPIYEYTP
jgi:hypothetical protein